MPTARLLGTAVAALAAAATGCHVADQLKDVTTHTLRKTFSDSYNDPDAEAKMARAEELTEQGQHAAAAKIFNDVASNTYNPVLLAERARFQEADCCARQGKLMEAVSTYHRQLQDFPAGGYREQACTRMYEIAYHEWLEKETLADIEAEQGGRKVSWWERQHFASPFDKTRPLLDTEGEALKALETVHTHDIVGPNADKALFWCGYVHFYRGRYEEADHYLSQLIEMHKDSKLRPVALELAIMAKNLSTGGPVYDSGKAAEALQLVHHTEATEPTYQADPKKVEWLTRQKMAVRLQLADKDFQMADYYERTGHPAPAYFYYELVCRRYPGTKYSDLAQERMKGLEKVKEQIAADRANGRHTGPTGAIMRELDRMRGKPVDPLGYQAELADRAERPAGPAGPTAAPADLPGNVGGPR